MDLQAKIGVYLVNELLWSCRGGGGGGGGGELSKCGDINHLLASYLVL